MKCNTLYFSKVIKMSLKDLHKILFLFFFIFCFKNIFSVSIFTHFQSNNTSYVICIVYIVWRKLIVIKPLVDLLQYFYIPIKHTICYITIFHVNFYLNYHLKVVEYWFELKMAEKSAADVNMKNRFCCNNRVPNFFFLIK